VGQLGGLVYTPPANQNGSPYTTFAFSVSDGTAFSAAPGTMTVNVTPVNDAPTTGNNAVTTAEDTPFTFAAGSFPFSDVDAGDTLQSVRIDALPGSGTLTLAGNPVSAGQVVPAGQLGNLVYAPPADQN